MGTRITVTKRWAEARNTQIWSDRRNESGLLESGKVDREAVLRASASQDSSRPAGEQACLEWLGYAVAQQIVVWRAYRASKANELPNRLQTGGACVMDVHGTEPGTSVRNCWFEKNPWTILFAVFPRAVAAEAWILGCCDAVSSE